MLLNDILSDQIKTAIHSNKISLKTVKKLPANDRDQLIVKNDRDVPLVNIVCKL